MRQLCRV